MSQHRFEFRQFRDPLFQAAIKFQTAVSKLPSPPGARAPREMLLRAANRITSCAAVAAELSEESAKQWTIALASAAKASSTLVAMRSCEFIDDAAYQQALELLEVVANRLDGLRRSSTASAPTSETTFEDEERATPSAAGGTSGAEVATASVAEAHEQGSRGASTG